MQFFDQLQYSDHWSYLERQFAINHREEADVDVDIDDNDDEEDEEEMSSDNSEQDIDLLEN